MVDTIIVKFCSLEAKAQRDYVSCPNLYSNDNNKLWSQVSKNLYSPNESNLSSSILMPNPAPHPETHTHAHTHECTPLLPLPTIINTVVFLFGVKSVFGAYYYYGCLNINHTRSMHSFLIITLHFGGEKVILTSQFTIHFSTLCGRQKPSFSTFRQIRCLSVCLFMETTSFLLPSLDCSAIQLSSGCFQKNNSPIILGIASASASLLRRALFPESVFSHFGFMLLFW